MHSGWGWRWRSSFRSAGASLNPHSLDSIAPSSAGAPLPGVATAARGEMAAESRQISHHDLRALDYGRSEILAFRDRMHSAT